MIPIEEEPFFLDAESVIEIHEEALAVSGGLAGIRDRNALESAVAAPKQLLTYQNADIVEMAAAYLFAIAKNHAFLDGNKRTAYISCLVYLDLNGISLGAPETLEIATLAVAKNQLDRAGLTGVLRQLVELQQTDPEYYRAVHWRQ